MGQKRRRKPRNSTSDTCDDSTNAEPPIPLDSETVTEPREDSSSTEPDLQIESSSSGVLVEAPPNDENGGSSDDNVDTKTLETSDTPSDEDDTTSSKRTQDNHPGSTPKEEDLTPAEHISRTIDMIARHGEKINLTAITELIAKDSRYHGELTYEQLLPIINAIIRMDNSYKFKASVTQAANTIGTILGEYVLFDFVHKEEKGALLEASHNYEETAVKIKEQEEHKKRYEDEEEGRQKALKSIAWRKSCVTSKREREGKEHSERVNRISGDIAVQKINIEQRKTHISKYDIEIKDGERRLEKIYERAEQISQRLDKQKEYLEGLKDMLDAQEQEIQRVREENDGLTKRIKRMQGDSDHTDVLHAPMTPDELQMKGQESIYFEPEEGDFSSSTYDSNNVTIHHGLIQETFATEDLAINIEEYEKSWNHRLLVKESDHEVQGDPTEATDNSRRKEPDTMNHAAPTTDQQLKARYNELMRQLDAGTRDGKGTNSLTSYRRNLLRDELDSIEKELHGRVSTHQDSGIPNDFHRKVNLAKTNRKREYHVMTTSRASVTPRPGQYDTNTLPPELWDQPLRQILRVNGMDSSLFEFILERFLTDGMETHPIRMSMTIGRIRELSLFLTMTKQDLNRLTTPTGFGNIPIPIGDIARICLVYDMINMLISAGIKYSEFMILTEADFDLFRRKGVLPYGYRQGAYISPFDTESLRQEARAELSSFRNNMKRDKEAFEEFKEGDDFRKWEAKASTTARNQAVDLILDRDSKRQIMTSEDAIMYDMKNSYWYEVLLHTMTEPTAAYIVNKYLDTLDGNACYQELRDYFTSEIIVQTKLMTMLNKIAEADLALAEKGYTEYLLDWAQTVREYEIMTHDISESNKITWLNRLCSRVPALDYVRRGALMDYTRGIVPRPPSFETQFALVRQEATLMDTKRGTIPRQRRNYRIPKRNEDEEDDSEDGSLPELVVNEHNQGRARYPPETSAIDEETQGTLSREDLEIWNSLSPGAQATIISKGRQLGNMTKSRRPAYFVKSSNTDDGDDDSKPAAEGREMLFDSGANEAITGEHGTHFHPDMQTTTISPSGHDDTQDETDLDEGSTTKYNVKATRIIINKRKTSHEADNAMVDRGANGGLAGEDVRIISRNDDCSIDVTGIDAHQMINVPTGTVGGLTTSNKGNVILIFHQYGITQKGHSIHSAVQMESHGVQVHDKALSKGGCQCLVQDGYTIPLDIRDGLPFIKMRKYTDREYEELPHIEMTSDLRWDPSNMDSILSKSKGWQGKVEQALEEHGMPPSPYTLPDDTSHKTRRNHRYSLRNNPERSERDAIVREETRYPRRNRRRRNDIDVSALDIIDAYAEDQRGATRHFPYRSENPDEWFREPKPKLYYRKANGEYYEESDEDFEFDDDPDRRSYDVYQAKRTLSETRYQELKPYFNHVSKEVLEHTLSNTTQFGRTVLAGPMIKEKHKSTFTACNIHRRNEPVATDTMPMTVPAINGGATQLQFFVGRRSLFIDVYGVKSDKEFPDVLQDIIRERGAMDLLISDGAKAETSMKVRDILRAYAIKERQSEPLQQQQNYAERAYRDHKARCTLIMETSGANPNEWLLINQYRAYIHNRTACKSNNWRTPYEMLTGQTPDISIIPQLRYRERVYYRTQDATKRYPNESTERCGFMVGFSETVGHSITYKILTEDTGKIIHRSRVRRAEDLPNPSADNRIRFMRDEARQFQPREVTLEETKNGIERMEKLNYQPGIDNVSREVIRKEGDTALDSEGYDVIDTDDLDMYRMPTIDLSTLKGRSYLTPLTENGERNRYFIEEVIEENERGLRLKVNHMSGSEILEDIIPYGKVVDFVNDMFTENPDDGWKFRRVLDHRRPGPGADTPYDFLFEEEDGERLWLPVKSFTEDDRFILADYCNRNGLIHDPGLRSLRGISKNLKKVARTIKQAQLRSFRTSVRYKYGIRIPQGHRMAMRFQEEEGHTKWRDAEIAEVKAIQEQQVFEDRGKGTGKPSGYTMIRTHMVYDVKHDGRYKARLVADGNMTKIPLESVYSGVVTLRSIRLILFIGEHNDLPLWATDVGNAYIESYTSEKVCTVAGEEFGELEGHLLVIVRALYGLRTSGKCWHDRFAEVLNEMGFNQCLADNDVWMRDAGDHYEYIGVYVDDLLIASKNPEAITKALTEVYHFNLKGTGPLTFHLGCDFFRDSDGVLCQSPKKYTKRIIDSYTRLFGRQPRTYKSPLEKGDHPELDDSEFLTSEGVKQYQSLIGSLQWAVSLGRFDIATAVMSLSSFRVAPRKGHLERAKRIIGYLAGMKDATLRYRTERPDLSDLPEGIYDWSGTPYAQMEGCEDEFPYNAPEPKGKEVDTVHFFDANLCHDMTTGRSVTGCLHFINKSLFDWYSSKQKTVNTSTFGSESDAGRRCTEHILDIRMTLRYMGVPLGRTVMFGDAKSVHDNMTRPHSKLNKRHSALSYHRIREAIAHNVMSFHHIPGVLNPADIVSKHWGYSDIWMTLKPILFYQGDTMDLIDDGEEPSSMNRGVKNCSPSQDNSGVSMNQDSPECEVHDEDGANVSTELDHKEIRGSLKKTDDPEIQTVDD